MQIRDRFARLCLPTTTCASVLKARIENPMDQLSERVGQKLEQNYVKKTYDDIAEDFSSTRYKKWPKVESFLRGLPGESLVLDVGCGNGKYLDNPSTFNIGCDLSRNLLMICKSRGHDVVRCDMLHLPFRRRIFDAIICIAALHHVATKQRRHQCLEGMTNLLSSRSSKLLIQVWSYEQETCDGNPYLKTGQGDADVDHPREIAIDDTVSIALHRNRTPFRNQDVLVPFQVRRDHVSTPAEKQHLRYYHVFRENELNDLIKQILDVKIVESYYDKGNWCSVISPAQI